MRHLGGGPSQPHGGVLGLQRLVIGVFSLAVKGIFWQACDLPKNERCPILAPVCGTFYNLRAPSALISLLTFSKLTFTLMFLALIGA